MDKKQRSNKQNEKKASHALNAASGNVVYGSSDESQVYGSYDESHDVEKLGLFYQSVIIMANGMHFLGTQHTDHEYILRKAFGYVLEVLAFGCTNYLNPLSALDYENIIVDSSNVTEVNGLRLPSGEVIRVDDIDFKHFANDMKQRPYDDYADHFFFLYPYLKKLAQGYDVSMQWIADTLLNGAIQATIGDEYTGFTRYNAEDSVAIEVVGSELFTLENYGLLVRRVDEGLLVVDADGFSCFEDIELKMNDVITHVNGEPLAEYRNYDIKILFLLALDSNEPIELCVTRGESDLRVALEPVMFKPPVVQGHLVQDNLAVIKISEFSYSVSDKLFDEVTRLQSVAKSRGFDGIRLALDLRKNGGGFIDSALEVLDSLLTPILGEGEPFATVEKRHAREVFFTGTLADRFIELEDDELYVFQDSSTASVSELVAGVLQDAGCLVIGTHSYGKATLQTAYEVNERGRLGNAFNESSGAGVLKVTEGVFSSAVTGLSNQDQGVIPNVMVHYEDFRRGLMAVLEYDGGMNTQVTPNDCMRGRIHSPWTYAVIRNEYSGLSSEDLRKAIPPCLYETYTYRDNNSGRLRHDTVVDAHMAALLLVINGESKFIDFLKKKPKTVSSNTNYQCYFPEP